MAIAHVVSRRRVIVTICTTRPLAVLVTMMAMMASVTTSVMTAAGCSTAGSAAPMSPAAVRMQALAAKSTDFAGSCSWGRAPGSAAGYGVALRVQPSWLESAPAPSSSPPPPPPSGDADTADDAIFVRGDAWFDEQYRDNIIGRLPVGAMIWGAGPVHAGGPSGAGATGYAVLLRGYRGRICRGYVRADDVRRMDGGVGIRSPAR